MLSFIVQQILPELLLTLSNGLDIDVMKTLSMKDLGLVLPTPCGLPVAVNVSGIFIGRMMGVISMEGLSSPMELFKVGPKPNIHIHSNLTPRY